MSIDDADRRLLRHLQADPAVSTSELAERAGLTTATCWRRIERLRAMGVIQGISADIDWAVLGYGLEVSLRFTLEKSNPRAFDAFIAAAREVPEVHEIHTFLGRVDVRLSLRARDLAHYQEVYRTRILTLPHIADIEALMHVADIKREEGLPL